MIFLRRVVGAAVDVAAVVAAERAEERVRVVEEHALAEVEHVRVRVRVQVEERDRVPEHVLVEGGPVARAE